MFHIFSHIFHGHNWVMFHITILWSQFSSMFIVVSIFSHIFSHIFPYFPIFSHIFPWFSWIFPSIFPSFPIFPGALCLSPKGCVHGSRSLGIRMALLGALGRTPILSCDFWWFLMIFDNCWWFLMMFDDVWWFLIVVDDFGCFFFIFGHCLDA